MVGHQPVAARGGGRLAGQDLTSLWLVTAVLAAALGLWAAWACLRVGDRTAGLLAVQVRGC